jgi:hypothetical protein
VADAASKPDWAEAAIEGACRRAEEWFRSLPAFATRAVVGGGQVVGRRSPAILSERDCVINFARFLNEEGVPWDAIHHEVSMSRWIFEEPHPAATSMTPAQRRRRLDLVLVKTEDFLATELPITSPGFQFDAVLEFGYFSDYWTVPGARIFNKDPDGGGRGKVDDDVKKVSRNLSSGACRLGYVIVFEECDWGFDESYAAVVEANSGCRVRFIRSF